MKILFRPILALGLLFSVPCARAADLRTIWPGAGPQPKQLTGEKAYHLTVDKTVISLAFKDGKGSDDYTHVDLGPEDLTGYAEGGYLEVDASTDQPIVRLSAVVADPQKFWLTGQAVEGGALMEKGSRTYRFYLDQIIPRKGEHLYLMLADLGGDARGNAQIQIRRVALIPPKEGWLEEKRSFYSEQYHWPKREKIEPLYREDFENAVPWATVSSNPLLNHISLNGEWQKKEFGERTWDYTFLQDTGPASPQYKPEGWQKVTVPEPAVPDQLGGHSWYRREIKVPANLAAQRIYLRLGDIGDDASIYVNGKLVGTQTSAEKRMDWVVENGSRSMVGVPAKKALSYQHFDRCQIPFPFDLAAVPEGKNRLILPIFTGHHDWPYAYDVTQLIKPGDNTIAIRLYGNPMRGWWIYRHLPDDRSSLNIFGILGSVELAIVPQSLIKNLTRQVPSTVAEDGTAWHRLDCALEGDLSTVREIRFRCGDQEITQTPAAADGGTVSAQFKLPTGFMQYTAEVAIIGNNGAILDQQSVNFHGVVVTTEGRSLKVNGEPYIVRGINSQIGVEFNSDRTATRREFKRLMRHYQQLGINTIRLSSAENWHLEEAFAHGIMVMPLTAAGSCNWMISTLGQLQDPDYELAWDRHRTFAAQLSDAPNILLWNGANEVHHTPGYVDREIYGTYLDGVQKAFKDHDAYRHPVTVANLDLWDKNWFFTQGQDIVGWNVYLPAPEVERQFKQAFAAAPDRPFVFTEWGTLKGKEDRTGKDDAWEADMRAKWDLISKTPACGGFLYPHHGELEDERGRKFLQDLLLPFVLKTEKGVTTITNRDPATMRDVEFTVVADTDVPAADFTKAIAPGETYQVQIPAGSKGSLEIRYTTHSGLKHTFTQTL